MNRKALAIFMLIAAGGLICFFAYNLIGAGIGSNGAPAEPFALIPVGYALLVIGLGGTVVFASIGWARKRRTLDRHSRTAQGRSAPSAVTTRPRPGGPCRCLSSKLAVQWNGCPGPARA